MKQLIMSLFLILPVSLLGGGGCFPNRAQQQFSWSIAEAKTRGTFVCEVEIIPDSLAFAGEKITFEPAWLERRPGGDYVLCFRIDKGKDVFKKPSSPFFVSGDRDASLEERHSRDFLQVIEWLASDDLSTVRASLIQSWKEERKKDIRFVRKDK